MTNQSTTDDDINNKNDNNDNNDENKNQGVVILIKTSEQNEIDICLFTTAKET